MLTVYSAFLHLHSNLVGFVGDRANKPLPPVQRLYCCFTSTSAPFLLRETHMSRFCFACSMSLLIALSMLKYSFLGMGSGTSGALFGSGFSLQTEIQTKAMPAVRDWRWRSVVQSIASGVHLTSNPGCDAGGWQWGGPRRWLVRTGDPKIRPRPLQTTQTHKRTVNKSVRSATSHWTYFTICYFTCNVLSNQRFPLLEKVPPPCRICAALRLAYLSNRKIIFFPTLLFLMYPIGHMRVNRRICTNGICALNLSTVFNFVRLVRECVKMFSHFCFYGSCWCMSIRVCAWAYFSSDILMTGESRQREKSPASISRTDSLLSLSESHRHTHTHTDS